MDRKSKATENFFNGCNCAQAVACAYCDIFGIPENQAFAATEGFGSGMGSGLGTCGALCGAVYIVSQKGSSGDITKPTSKRATYAMSGALSKGFFEKCGALSCRDIKAGGRASCAKCVEYACDLLDDILCKA